MTSQRRTARRRASDQVQVLTEQMDTQPLAYWRERPIEFIETVLYNPETGEPFELLPAERAFLEHAFKIGPNSKLVYNEWLYSCPKKSGKTTFEAMIELTMTLLFGGAFPESYILANSLEQGKGRVFEICCRIVQASPLLRNEAEILADTIRFPAFNATIKAIPSDAGSAAGTNAVCVGLDELWAYTSERARRLWDEMVPPPTRKIACRVTVTYAGYEGESVLLEELYHRGKQQPLIGEDLYAGDGLLMFWSHKPIAHWQDEDWLNTMRRERASSFQRMCLNEFSSSSSQFVNMVHWDRCCDESLTPLPSAPFLGVCIGVDASLKHDQTAVAVTTIDDKSQVRLVYHRIFQPSPERPLDFEQTIEATLLELSRKYQVKKILFDPYQMMAVAQRLVKQGLPVEEFPQTAANLTAASQNLFDLIESQSLIMYPDDAIRLAVSRCVAVESSRGWKISKEKGSHKIDVVVALAMACHAAIKSQSEPFFDRSWNWVSGPDNDEATRKEQERKDADAFTRARLHAHLAAHGAFGGFPFR